MIAQTLGALDAAFAEAVQVQALGVRDSSDADFPAIYDDLFGKRTFDAANGGWSFKSYASYTLPEFL